MTCLGISVLQAFVSFLDLLDWASDLWGEWGGVIRNPLTPSLHNAHNQHTCGDVTAGWVRGRQKSSVVPRLMWKGMGPSFSYLFLISTCFFSVLASQNPQLKYTEISPWQSLSTGSSPVKWAPVSEEDICGWEGGISLTPLLFAGLDLCSTQDPGHKNCFGTCSSWDQPCVSGFEAEFEQPTTHPAAWRAGMVRAALAIMPTWQNILLPNTKRMERSTHSCFFYPSAMSSLIV